MKLPNFLEYKPLNDLRENMGAELGEFNLIITKSKTTLEERKSLKTGGIDIDSVDDIDEWEDGTLVYKDQRVLVYIRDIQSFWGWGGLPKFHVASCWTIDEMRNKNRGERYVVSNRTDGIFEMRKTNNNNERSERKLDVCKNCLMKLNYKGYFDYSKSNDIFRNFKLAEFFEKYPESPWKFKPKPKHTSSTGPTNEYSSDFPEISKAYKEEKKWICDSCKDDLSETKFRKFLHTHHINGRKDENSPSNLKCLCISCHAKQPGHGHMKSLPDYKKYQRMRSIKRYTAF